MSKTLYRTYRPQEFSDVLGQDHITKTLQNAISIDRVGHAYLFTGPRGTGKTTVARLFATSVNKNQTNVPDDAIKRMQNGTSMDLIEIDAASNTGVDAIRTLKETVGTSPTETAFKIYIIDEVHMLSTSAFNALLKTLEEPPEHVIFILATTEIHKVPDTIISRCQRFDFLRFNIEDIVTKLTSISKNENVTIEASALEMIAFAADGGMRDAESILSQVFAIGEENITEQDVSKILGTTTSKDVLSMLAAFTESDLELSLTTISNITSSGYNTEAFAKSIIEKLRALLFISLQDTDTNTTQLLTISKYDFKKLTEISSKTTTPNIIFMIEEFEIALQKIKNSTIPQLPLEIASIDICNKNHTNVPHGTQSSKSNSKQVKSQTTQKKGSTKKHVDVTEEAEKKSNNMITNFDICADDTKLWQNALLNIEQENKSISSLLTQCELLEITPKAIILTTTFSFYKDKIKETSNKLMIEEKLSQSFNHPMKIKISILTKKNTEKTSELLNYATELMGTPATEC